VKPYVQSAVLYLPSGAEFAVQDFGDRSHPIVDRSCIDHPRTDIALGTAYVVFADDGRPHANLCKTIVMDGEAVGVLQIVVDLSQYNEEISSYIVLAGEITLVLLLLAMALAWSLQGLISKPILRLSDIMQRVARDRDYKVRVRKHGNDEIGTLIDCFHEMLARIERHDASLTTARLEAEAASRAKSSFLATMSHELRTPLNAILGFSEIMMTETFGPLGSANYRDYTRDIYDSGMHLLNVINDVLDLSKVEAGRLELNRADIDVEDTVEAALRFFRERSKKAGLTLTAAIEPCLPPLFADERVLRQCILNLVSNAIKFTPSGGSVAVAVRSETGGWTSLSVADNGIGIAEADIPRVLTPFSQADNAYVRKQEGTGLGLPLVKSFAELHGGTFAIASELGVGTTVTVRFPPRPASKPAAGGQQKAIAAVA
jgi:signal transduction histidine kinase